jgi:hypothetical protein
VLISPTIAGADDSDDWLVVVDPAALLAVVGVDNVEGAPEALNTNDWVVELGTAESKVLVEGGGEEGSELLVEDCAADDGAPDGKALLKEDWDVEIGGLEDNMLVKDEGEAGNEPLDDDDGDEGSELLVDEDGSTGSELLVEDDGEAGYELLVEDCIVELDSPEGKALLVVSAWFV